MYMQIRIIELYKGDFKISVCSNVEKGRMVKCVYVLINISIGK